MKCFKCGNQINIDFSKIPTNIKTLDTKCENCGCFVKLGNPNYVEDTRENNSINNPDDSELECTENQNSSNEDKK